VDRLTLGQTRPSANAVLHGVRLVDAHAVDDRHGADQFLGFLKAVGVEDAVPDEGRRRIEGQVGAARRGEFDTVAEGAAGVDQPRSERGEPRPQAF
jgi:hypothetical protein